MIIRRPDVPKSLTEGEVACTGRPQAVRVRSAIGMS